MNDCSNTELRKITEAYENMLSDNSDSQFSTKALDNLRYFNERVDYCKKHLKYLGRGTSRMAFLMPNGHVLKLAFNAKGIAQNEAECGDWYKNSLRCFPDVYDAADDHTWCEVESARKCTKSDFPRIMGITFEELCDLLVKLTRDRGTGREFPYRHLNTSDERLAEIEQNMWDNGDDNPTLTDLNDYIGNYGANEFLVNDFFALRNWGIVDRDGGEQLVVTDSGLTEDVWKGHYDPQRAARRRFY